MLAKLNVLSPNFARQEGVDKSKTLTYKHWIVIDRIVMATLFIAVIIAAVLFSN